MLHMKTQPVQDLARRAAAALDTALRESVLRRHRSRPDSLRTAFWPSDLLLCPRKTALGFWAVERDPKDPRVLEAASWGISTMPSTTGG